MIYLIVLLLFLSNTLFGQSDDIFTKLLAKEENKGTIIIQQNSGIANLIQRNIDLNKEFRGVPGFRIQIYFGSGNQAKDDALKIRKEFRDNNPNLETYLTYEAPYFKVRVGDYRNRYEAYIALRKISEKYTSAFLVDDLITPIRTGN